MNRKLIKSFQHRGMALIVALFIVLAMTAVAILALRSTHSEEQMSYQFRLNRQAVHASHQAAAVTLGELNKNAILLAASAQMEGLTKGLDAMTDKAVTEENLAAAWEARQSSSAHSYNADFFTPLTGLGINVPSPTDTSRIHGDLMRRVAQSAAVGQMSMSELETGGFSQGSEFCNYFLQMDAAATVGLPPSSQGTFYFASDLERAFATKRDLTKVQLEPIACQ